MQISHLTFCCLMMLLAITQPIYADNGMNSSNPMTNESEPSLMNDALFLVNGGLATSIGAAIVWHTGNLSSPEGSLIPIASFFIAPSVLRLVGYKRHIPTTPPSPGRRRLSLILHFGTTIAITSCYAALRGLTAP
jgi:hypothetical protein